MAEGGEEAELLRAAYTLLAVAPAGFRERPAPLDRARFEEMLHCRAWESAAMLLLPAGATYTLSSGDAELAMASVQLPDDGDEMVAEAAHAATALIAALASALRFASDDDLAGPYHGELYGQDMCPTGSLRLN